MLRIQPLNNNILRFYLPHVYMFYILRHESCPKKCKIDHVTVHRSKGGLNKLAPLYEILDLACSVLTKGTFKSEIEDLVEIG